MAKNEILKPAIINDIEYQVLKRNVGDTTIKHVFLNFGGKFPKNYIQYIDITTPKRLYPNAKFTIRCNTRDINTITYFQNAYDDREINFYDDDNDILYSDDYQNADLLYCPWIGNARYSNILTKNELFFHYAIHNFKGIVQILFNDIALATYRCITDVINERVIKKPRYFCDQKYKLEIESILENNSNYKSLSIIIRNNIMEQYPYWWNSKMKKISFPIIDKHKYSVEVLSDILQYNFPDIKKLHYKQSNNIIPKGLFIGTCFKERVELFEKLFPEKIDNLQLDICGANSEKINSPYASQNGRVISSEVPELFKKYDYGIYVARGKKIPFAGMSIYDPIVYGKPVFIYEPIDSERLLMPGIDSCYFNTAEELLYNINNANFKELYEQQRDSLYERM